MPWTEVLMRVTPDMLVVDVCSRLVATLCRSVPQVHVKLRLVSRATAHGTPTPAEERASVVLERGEPAAAVGIASGVALLLDVAHDASYLHSWLVEYGQRTGLYCEFGDKVTRLLQTLRSGETAQQSTVRVAANGTSRTVQFLRLPGEDMRFPHLYESTLLIRDCYDNIFTHALNGMKVEPGKTRAYYAVVGNPDMSKSAFAWYVIARVLKEQPHRPILYSSNASGSSYWFAPGRPVVHGSVALVESSLPRDALWVVDGRPPHCCECAVLYVPFNGVVTREARHFMKDGACTVHMPSYDEEEIWDLRHVAYPDIPTTTVRRIMAVYGPNPRLAMSPPSFARSSWRGGIRSLQPVGRAAIMGSLGETADNFVAERLTITHQPGLRTSKYWKSFLGEIHDFASPLLADWAMRRCGFDTVGEARRAMTELHAPLVLYMAEGYRWPHVVAAVLTAGGVFRCQALRRRVRLVGGDGADGVSLIAQHVPPLASAQTRGDAADAAGAAAASVAPAKAGVTMHPTSDSGSAAAKEAPPSGSWDIPAAARRAPGGGGAGGGGGGAAMLEDLVSAKQVATVAQTLLAGPTFPAHALLVAPSSLDPVTAVIVQAHARRRRREVTVSVLRAAVHHPSLPRGRPGEGPDAYAIRRAVVAIKPADGDVHIDLVWVIPARVVSPLDYPWSKEVVEVGDEPWQQWCVLIDPDVAHAAALHIPIIPSPADGGMAARLRDLRVDDLVDGVCAGTIRSEEDDDMATGAELGVNTAGEAISILVGINPWHGFLYDRE